MTDAFSVKAPLWTGLDALAAAFAAALRRIGPVEGHAVTMTGELSDLFEDRAHGVERLLALAGQTLGGPATIAIYGGRLGFLPPEEAIRHPRAVASANWHATAALVATRLPEALLVDVGSTTTDLIPVAGGVVAEIGATDAERLASGALLYSGATRMPVMALCRAAPFEGRRHALVAEHFATMADVRRLTGEILPDEAADTADRRGASLAESRARLARMIGRDAGDAPDAAWDAFARYLGERQLAQMFEAAALVLSRGDLTPEASVVCAGSGSFLARALASRLGRRAVAFESLIAVRSGLEAAASETAPAAAAALLAWAGKGPAG